jgi:uncharacterized DUF497 family protein
MQLRFDWDKKKAETNQRKHGSSFDLAQKVNGFAIERQNGERFSDHRRRHFADKAVAEIV